MMFWEVIQQPEWKIRWSHLRFRGFTRTP